MEAGTQFMFLKLFPSCSPAPISHFPPLHLTCSLCSPDWLHSPAAHLQQSSWLARVLLHAHTVTTMLFACMQDSPALPTCMFLSFADAACLWVAPLVCLQVKPARILFVPDLEFCFSVFGCDPPPVVVFYPAEFTAANRLRKFPVFLLVCNWKLFIEQLREPWLDLVCALVTVKPKNILINQVSNPHWENIMENNYGLVISSTFQW